MSITTSNLLGRAFNDLYLERPVWAHVSSGTTSSLAQPVVALYGERSPYNALSVEYTGNAKSRARSFTDESANSNYTFYGNASGASAQGAYSPTGGIMGINSIGSQTVGLAQFDVYDSGTYGWYHSQNANTPNLASHSAVVVGEENWRQTFDLVFYSGKLYKEQIGGSMTMVLGSNRPFIDFASQAALGGGYAPNANWTGAGQVSYNRNTKRLMVAQCIAGTNAVSLTYRLHFFDLQLTIGRTTTLEEIRTAIRAACKTGDNRYRFVDVVCASTAIYHTAISSYDAQGTRFVLCDNDEVWAFKSSDSAASASINVLWRINLSGGTWFTGAYTATAQANMPAANTYGPSTNLGNSGLYTVKHMNSDDNSVIALYQHAYYYCGGANIAFVSTKGASAASFNYFADSTADYFYSLAPSGDANFVLSRCGAGTATNMDGAGSHIGHIDNSKLNSTNVSGVSFQSHFYPVMSSSTCYGVSNVVMKVQPTSEWK